MSTTYHVGKHGECVRIKNGVEVNREGTKMNERRLWECSECGFSTTWDYDDLVERGTPVCPEDGTDMVLSEYPIGQVEVKSPRRGR